MSTNTPEKAATLAAKLALAGLEMRAIRNCGAIAFYEVRRGADQIARRLDLPVEDVQAVIDAHADPADLHRGPVHTLQ